MRTTNESSLHCEQTVKYDALQPKRGEGGRRVTEGMGGWGEAKQTETLSLVHFNIL
jgi:hypothetical protein